MAPDPAPDTELAALRVEVAHLRRVNQELLATLVELRATVEKQQAHIARRVRMTSGRRSERATEPVLPDEVPDPDPSPVTLPPSAPDPPPRPLPRGGEGTAVARCRPTCPVSASRST